MNRIAFIAITAICSITFAQRAEAKCPEGFSRPRDSINCLPIDSIDRIIWEACGSEPEHYGLFEAEPCMSSHSRKALTDKFVDYCRKHKLPHLFKQHNSP